MQVIDLRSLLPWDKDLVATEVARTGRIARRPRGRRSPAASAPRWRPGWRSTASPTSTPRCAGWAPTDTHVAYEPTPGQCHPAPGRLTSPPPPGGCWPSRAAGLVWSPGVGANVAAWLRKCAASSPGKKAHLSGVETVVVPDPGPGEALVAVRACGVCHTDLHYREGSINDDFPFLLGHEAAGTVEAVGPGGHQRGARRLRGSGLAGPVRPVPLLPPGPALVLLRQRQRGASR